MWTYLEIDEEGNLLPGSPELPGPKTVYLGYDAIRETIVLGYTEWAGYHSFLDPNVNDDCNIVAFAPVTETALPDLERIRAMHPSYKKRVIDLSEMPYTLWGVSLGAEKEKGESNGK